VSFRRTLGTLVALAGLLLVQAPVVQAADPLIVTTPYPAIVVAPGARPSFNVSITTPTPERVTLALSGAPTGWTAAIHGGGFTVDAVETGGVQADGTNPATSIRVDVTVPTDATGSATIVLRANAGGVSKDLSMTVRVAADAGGDVTLKTDFPSLRGPASQNFNFNLTLSNQTAEDLTFAVNAQGPSGWTINTTLTGQSQAATALIAAGTSTGVTVAAKAPSDVAAGSYDIQVVATAGARTIQGSLSVEVTGSYSLSVSTSDGRLNGSGSAGSSADVSVVVTNTGTAPVTNVNLTGSAPSGWKVTFDQEKIDSIAANASQTVLAHIVPSGDAVAGDYDVTLKAAGDQSTSGSVDIRFTVETSLVWAIVGIALIVAVFAGLWWVFQQYGRR
jgi:uncharacterized membrane protein